MSTVREKSTKHATCYTQYATRYVKVSCYCGNNSKKSYSSTNGNFPCAYVS